MSFFTSMHVLLYEHLQIIPYLRFVDIGYPKFTLNILQLLVPLDFSFLPNIFEDSQYKGYFELRDKQYIKSLLGKPLFPSAKLDYTYRERCYLTELFVLNATGKVLLLLLAIVVVLAARHRRTPVGRRTKQMWLFQVPYVVHQVLVMGIVFDSLLQIWYYSEGNDKTMYSTSITSILFGVMVVCYIVSYYLQVLLSQLANYHSYYQHLALDAGPLPKPSLQNETAPPQTTGRTPMVEGSQDKTIDLTQSPNLAEKQLTMNTAQNPP